MLMFWAQDFQMVGVEVRESPECFPACAMQQIHNILTRVSFVVQEVYRWRTISSIPSVLGLRTVNSKACIQTRTPKPCTQNQNTTYIYCTSEIPKLKTLHTSLDPNPKPHTASISLHPNSAPKALNTNYLQPPCPVVPLRLQVAPRLSHSTRAVRGAKEHLAPSHSSTCSYT